MNVSESVPIVNYLWLLATPLLSYMLWDWMQPTMILDWWYKILDKFKIPEFFQKPMGKCLKCFHVWVFIGSYISLGLPLELPIFSTLLAVSYTILVKLFYS